jgi:hypothetical protein
MRVGGAAEVSLGKTEKQLCSSGGDDNTTTLYFQAVILRGAQRILNERFYESYYLI